ncbi:MAG: DNA polymerase III subunit beta [Actinomycetota bacterium]|nr:DNA polymerase III subunit beta [Actinomycetota bacterium]
MIIKLAQSDFLTALQTVQRGASSQSTLPILTGIKIRAEKTVGAVLQSTDLELSIESVCPATVKKEGTVVVTGKLLVDIVRHLPDGAIELSSEDDEKNLIVKAESASFKVKTMPPEDFPAFPEVETKKSVSIEAQTLVEMIRQTGKAVSRDETRPVLTGALLSIEEKNLLLVATDSYRLAIKSVPTKTAGTDKISILIPIRALEEIQRALAATKGEARLSTNENLLKIEADKMVMVSRLIEGQFPNYKQLIPKETLLRAEADKQEVVAAISRVALLAQKNMSVKMTADAQKIHVQAATQGVGEAQETVKAKTKGEAVGEMAFNAQYLLDGLQGASGEKIVFEFTGPVNPGVIKAGNADDYLYLIMPIRIN